MAEVSLEQLLESGAHFGHQTRRWNPKMDEYIYDSVDGIHVFDLTKTKESLENALNFLEEAAKDGKSILLLGAKRQAQDVVKKAAKDVGCFYVAERWLGGTITNFDQINKSLKKLEEMKKTREEGGYQEYTKKERVEIDREIERLERFFGGIQGMEDIPDVLVIVDVKREKSAVREAKNKGVTVVGIVDSNADPDIEYPIPMNDDAVKAIEYAVGLMGEAIKTGKKKTKKKKPKKEKSRKKVRASQSAKS